MTDRAKRGLYQLAAVASLGFMSMAVPGCSDPAPAVVYDCYADAECNRDGKINGTCSPATHQCTYPVVAIQPDVYLADGRVKVLERYPSNNLLLPLAVIGVPYEVRLGGMGGDGSYAWAPTVGAGGTELAPGIQLSADGVLSGIPTATMAEACLSIGVTSAGTLAHESFCVTVADLTPNALAPASPVGAGGEVLLPNGRLETEYVNPNDGSQVFITFGGGGRAPYKVGLVSGPLPPGLLIQASYDSDGVYLKLFGAPTAVGTFPFTVRFSDGYYDCNLVDDPAAVTLLEKTFSFTVLD